MAVIMVSESWYTLYPEEVGNNYMHNYAMMSVSAWLICCTDKVFVLPVFSHYVELS